MPLSFFSCSLLKPLADLTFLALSIRALWLLVAWGRMQAQIWRYRLTKAQIKARVLAPHFPVSRWQLFLAFVCERLAALPLMAPFVVGWRMVRTRLPYTRKERGLLMTLRFLQALVEMGLLFPTFFLGLPPLLYDFLVWSCWVPLWSRADAIERSCQPDVDDEWDERDEWEETSTSDNAVLIGEDDL